MLFPKTLEVGSVMPSKCAKIVKFGLNETYHQFYEICTSSFCTYCKHNLGLRALWSCSAFIGRAWGLSPKMALWLYKRVIIPKIIYAAVAWWYRMDIALVRSKLERLQRAACIMIAGAMRTTPTKVLRMFLDLSTLGMAMTSAALMALMAAYCLVPTEARFLSGQKQIKWIVSSVR